MGVAWIDYDLDADLDLFVANYGGGNFLYQNAGNGVFTPRSDSAATLAGSSTGCVWADFDNDGDVDLVVINSGGGDHFYFLNSGDGTFLRSTQPAFVQGGTESYGGGSADYDNDGRLDLVVVAAARPNALYHNDGGGSFSRVVTGDLANDVGGWIGCAWGDYDNDGWMDLFLASGADSRSNALYRNNRNGTFTAMTHGAIVEDGGAAINGAWGDYNNDGYLDLFVANRGGNNFLYRNNGNGTFTKITDGAIVTDRGESNGCAWGDYDNDGYLDLFVANWNGHRCFLYHNNGDGTFARVTTGEISEAGTSSTGVAWGDYNNDGFLDLFVANFAGQNQLYRNRGNENHWLVLKCIGTQSNRSAIGAKVRIKTTIGGVERWQLREISTGFGWCSVGPNAHFGLGSAAVADTVRIEWPSGIVQRFSGVPANQTVTITEEQPLLTISPLGGPFSNAIEVTMSTTVPQGQIRYTIDGTDPGPGSPLYDNPLTLTASSLVRARVYVGATAASDIVSATFYRDEWNDGVPVVWRTQHFGQLWFNDPRAGALADPDQDGGCNYQEWLTGKSPVVADSEGVGWPSLLSFTPSSGVFAYGTNVFLASAVSSAQIRFTSDGSEPTPTSMLYGEPIPLTQTTTLKARAYVNANPVSPLVAATFTRQDPPIPTTLVVPQGTEAVEGDTASGPISADVRIMEVYGARHFPPRPFRITGMRLRPDAGSSAFSVNLSDLEVVLSTTPRPPDGLSPKYAENIGPDAATVFRGPLSLSSAASGPASGPKAFDIAIPFTQPFLFDPTKGNLLVDIRNYSSVTLPWTDATMNPEDGASRQYSFGTGSTDATWVNSGAEIIEFLLADVSVTFSPAAGWVTAPTEIRIETSIPGGAIRFTLDGSPPTVESPLYSQPLTISQSTLIRAQVYTNGVAASDVVEATYLTQEWNDGIPSTWRAQYFGSLWFSDLRAAALADPDDDGSNNYQERLAGTNPTVADPAGTAWPALVTFSPDGGTFYYQTSVTLTTAAEGGVIRFTTDGSEPGTGSSTYETPIALNATTTLKARVFVNANPISPVLSRTFTRDVLVHPPGAVVPKGSEETEADGNSGPLNHHVRIQEVYGAAEFMPAPILITEVRYRPDSTTAAFTTTIEDVQIILSTTTRQPDALSMTFADNLGEDARVVFRGRLAVSSTALGPPAGPKAFDIAIPLAIPFFYDPARGNLLIDIQNPTDVAMPFVDSSNSTTDAASRVFVSGGSSTTAEYSGSGASVVLFVGPASVPDLYIDPPGGAYDRTVEVGLFTWIKDGQVRYTLDGTEPTLDSPAYTARVKLTQNTTLKARVFANGQPATEVRTETYAITLTAPQIAEHPSNATVNQGGSVTFKVAATGSMPLRYQWTWNGADLAGATGSELRLANVLPDRAGVYAVRVTNDAGSVASNPATLIVRTRPTVVRQPESQMAAVGGLVEFVVEATGTEPLTYQWYRGGAPVTGATTPTLTIDGVQPSHAGSYIVRITNPLATVASRPATLNVVDQPIAPGFTSHPSGAVLSAGDTATLTAVATGTSPLRYQWYLNGAALPGATRASLTLDDVTQAQAGTYWLEVSNPAGSKASNPAILEVQPSGSFGAVRFDNHAVAYDIDAPVFDSDGATRLAGLGYLARLYAGLTAEQLAPVGAARPFGALTLAGYWLDSPTPIVQVPFEPGTPTLVQVRVWESAKGTTYEQAYAVGGKVGASEVLTITTGGGGIPPTLPAPLTGLRSWSVQAEAVPPVLAVASPVPGATHDERVTLEGTVTDNTGALPLVRWEWDGQDMGALPVTQSPPAPEGRFRLEGLVLHRGENRFKVIARDAAGNQAAQEIAVTWDPLRTLQVVSSDPQQEGARLAFGLDLASAGEVAGLSFRLEFDPTQFRDPELVWADDLPPGLRESNLESPGAVRGTLAVSGTIPAGARPLAVLSLRARSVPDRTVSQIAVRVVDVSDGLGNKLLFGTETIPAQAVVLPRRLKGDNNGNDRLDVGDATVIQRLLIGLETVRPWDVTGNDLNASLDLDSGDVVKVLRVVVELDPTPSLATAGLGATSRAGLMGQARGPVAMALDPGAVAVLKADAWHAAPGSTVTVQLRLANVGRSVAGASFRLAYPAGALRVVDANSLRAGPLVPKSALVLWNVAGGYEAQSGVVSCAITTASSWAEANGVLAELTFQVLPGAGSAAWPLSLANLELTSGDGYDLLALPASGLNLNPLPTLAPGLRFSADGSWVSFTGEPGFVYTVEASNDLEAWEPVATRTAPSGLIEILDAAAKTAPMRFYRVREGE